MQRRTAPTASGPNGLGGQREVERGRLGEDGDPLDGRGSAGSRAGSAVGGSTRVAPSSVSVVIEPRPAMVWNGMTKSQVSSGPGLQALLHAGAVEIR